MLFSLYTLSHIEQVLTVGGEAEDLRVLVERLGESNELAVSVDRGAGGVSGEGGQMFGVGAEDQRPVDADARADRLAVDEQLI